MHPPHNPSKLQFLKSFLVILSGLTNLPPWIGGIFPPQGLHYDPCCAEFSKSAKMGFFSPLDILFVYCKSLLNYWKITFRYLYEVEILYRKKNFLILTPSPFTLGGRSCGCGWKFMWFQESEKSYFVDAFFSTNCPCNIIVVVMGYLPVIFQVQVACHPE